DACLAVRTEREKIEEQRRNLLALGRGDHPAERTAHHELAHEVERREQDPRHPDQYVARAGRLVAAPVVVGKLALFVLRQRRVTSCRFLGWFVVRFFGACGLGRGRRALSVLLRRWRSARLTERRGARQSEPQNPRAAPN